MRVTNTTENNVKRKLSFGAVCVLAPGQSRTFTDKEFKSLSQPVMEGLAKAKDIEVVASKGKAKTEANATKPLTKAQQKKVDEAAAKAAAEPVTTENVEPVTGLPAPTGE